MTSWYANERQPQATVQLDVHFIDAVQVGEFVEAKCQVVRRTRSLVFMSGELMVGDRVVATAKASGRRWGRSESVGRVSPLGRNPPIEWRITLR